MRSFVSFPALLLFLLQNGLPDLRKTALKSTTPSDEIVRLDINKDGKPDILERWWNGKRVRWLDENGDMLPTDTRGDQVADVMQIDKNGDGLYDSALDINIKWADNDGDGRADLQAFVTQGREWSNGQLECRRVALDGLRRRRKRWRARLARLGKLRFRQRQLGLHRHDRLAAGLQRQCCFSENSPAAAIASRSATQLGKPLCFLRLRRRRRQRNGDSLARSRAARSTKDVTNLSGVLNEAFATFDLDNDSTKGNETDYDMSLRGAGGPGIPYRSFVHKYPALKGNPKFDQLLSMEQLATDRRADVHAAREELRLVLHRSLGHVCISCLMKTTTIIAGNAWRCTTRCTALVVQRRSISIRPNAGAAVTTPKQAMVALNERPGINGHPQADSLGDRGEFDEDNSGGGKLYVGVFDRKLHLAGAEWGAWTVDKNAEFHGGNKTPSPKPMAHAR